MSYIEYDDETPPPSQSNFNNNNISSSSKRNNNSNNTNSLLDPRRSQISRGTGGTGASPRESRVDSNNLADNVNAMRHRQSLLDGLRNSGFVSSDACPPPTMMYKPGSADENASGFTKAFKRLASSWKKRRVVIINNMTFQYEDPDSKKISGQLKLDDITQVKLVNRAVMKDRGGPENLRDFGWFLIAGGREYIFACESASVRDTWVAYLSAVVKQRQNDEQYLGDDGDGRSYQNTARNSRARGTSNLDGPGNNYNNNSNNNNNGNDDHGLAPEALKANQDVFDAVAQYKSQQYMKRGGSGDGGSVDDNGDADERNRLLNDDDDDDEDEEEQSSAASGDSEILVERGDEVVAATIDKSKVKKQAIIQVPAPNAAYRRENVVIEALFEDLRTQEPDHVRLAGLETPECAVSYFQPQLLRAAQDGDLPGDLPPRPLLVTAFLPNANQAKAPLRNDSLLPSSRIKAMAKELERMELVQRTPSYRGLHIVVVDADGLVVGGSSHKNINDNSTKGIHSLYDFANYVQCRHFAAKTFTLVSLPRNFSSISNARPINNNNSTLIAANNNKSITNNNTNFNNNGSIAYNMASVARQNTAQSIVATTPATGSPRERTKTVYFPDHPPTTDGGGATAPTSARSGQQQQARSPNRDNNSEFPRSGPSPNSSPTTKDNTKGFENKSFTAAAVSGGGGNNSVNGNDDASSVTGGTQTNNTNNKGLGNLFTQSIAALRSRGGGGGNASVAGGMQHHASLLSDSAVGHLAHLTNTANLFGKDGNAAGPAAHGPVIVIETTRRKVTITDAAYRSNILGNDALVKKRPPLYWITTEEVVQK